jgi:hypothetical protein
MRAGRRRVGALPAAKLPRDERRRRDREAVTGKEAHGLDADERLVRRHREIAEARHDAGVDEKPRVVEHALQDRRTGDAAHLARLLTDRP